MKTRKLDHYFIRTNDIESTVKFYERALDLKRGFRPPFPFPGAWMYLEDKPVVHIGPSLNGATKQDSTGPIGHVAFSGGDYQAQMRILKDLGISADVQQVPEENQYQVFFKDPNGIIIELDFDME